MRLQARLKVDLSSDVGLEQIDHVSTWSGQVCEHRADGFRLTFLISVGQNISKHLRSMMAYRWSMPGGQAFVKLLNPREGQNSVHCSYD